MLYLSYLLESPNTIITNLQHYAFSLSYHFRSGLTIHCILKIFFRTVREKRLGDVVLGDVVLYFGFALSEGGCGRSSSSCCCCCHRLVQSFLSARYFRRRRPTNPPSPRWW